MNKPLLRTAAGLTALAAGLAGAQTYSTYPGYGYGYDDYDRARVVRCESINSRRNFCRVDTRGGVQISRQLSREQCVRGRNWQATADGIRVSGGCRAEFVVNTGYDDRYQTYNGNYATDRYGRRVYGDRVMPARDQRGETFHCQGTGHGRTYCGQRGQHYALVYRSPSCILNRNWGNDGYGTWVSGTCNADFSVRPIADDDRVYDNRGYDDGYPPGYGPGTYAPPTYGSSQAIYCQSTGTGRTYCGDRNRSYSLRHNNDAYCVLNETYGRDSYGVWVAGACNLTLDPGAYDRY